MLLKKSREIAQEKDFIKKEKEKHLDASNILTAKILDQNKTIKFIRDKYDKLVETYKKLIDEHLKLLKEHDNIKIEYKTFLKKEIGEGSEP